MYTSNMTHVLDERGNIIRQVPKEARELTEFLAMIIESTTKTTPTTLTSTDVRCPNKGCFGLIKSAVKPMDEVIHWYCPICEDEGEIRHWQHTRWNNFRK